MEGEGLDARTLPRHPDVLIVGGGINGAGLFRELALQGVRVVLVDKGDFCSGSSAAPSRMIHGGLRYLEYGETRLVRESLRERDALLVRDRPQDVGGHGAAEVRVQLGEALALEDHRASLRCRATQPKLTP